MKKVSNHNSFEKTSGNMDSTNENMRNQHENDLGYGIPKDYFSNSKKELEKIILSPKKGKVVFFNNRSVLWIAASVITIFVALTVFKPSALPNINSFPEIVADSIESFKNNNLANDSEFYLEDDISIASLFINDSEIDEYVENFIIEDIIKEEKLK